MDWRTRLEQLRKEQNPNRYGSTECPQLHAPSPEPPRPQRDDEDEKPQRGVVVIDI